MRLGCSAHLGSAEQLLDFTPYQILRLLGGVGEPPAARAAPAVPAGHQQLPGATGAQKLTFLRDSFD